jgi:DNA-binding NarL/FixJ family response regulator
MIGVLVVDEILLICNVVASMLREEKDIHVVGCATTVEEATEQIQQVDIALVSTTIADKDIFQLVRTLAKTENSPKVVVMGVPESEEIILQYIEAGVAGYVLRDDSADDLVEKIRAVARGEAPVSPQIVAALMERVAELKRLCDDVDNDTSLSTLTAREREVLDLLEQGLTNQEIANQLVIEVGTVKNHVHSILKKLNLDSRRDLVLRNSVKGS